MKSFKLNIALFVVAVVAVISIALETRTGRGQTQSPTNESRVKSTVLRPASRGGGSAAGTTTKSSAFVSAAARNAVLRNDLTWTFGGKQQRGWYLYTSLIGRLLNTEADASSPAF